MKRIIIVGTWKIMLNGRVMKLLNLRSLRDGAIVGNRFRMLRPLGKGGMGNVFLVEDLKMRGKLWAMKEIRIAPEDRLQLHQEAEVLMGLNHPFLPDIVDYFPNESDDRIYFVMEYVDGVNLQDWFETHRGKPAVQAVISIGIQMCELLQYLHEQLPQPIIYRDVKPSNMMLDRQNHIRLIDFGTARSYKAGQNQDTLQLGTFAFAAPEQIKGTQTDHRTDLYQLGATLYYLLSEGQYYYTLRKPLHEVSNRVSEQLSLTLSALLEDQPKDRIQSAILLRKQLECYLKHQLDPTEDLSSVNHSFENRDKVQEARRPMGIERTIIAVGSLFPSAGSTFTCVTLARLLNHYGVPNTLIEHPRIEPELYEWLHGDKHAPAGYNFYTDRSPEDKHRKHAEWIKGQTQWYPANPDKPEQMSQENKLIWLTHQKSPIVIIDMSDRWDLAEERDWISIADMLLITAEPDPVKMNRRNTAVRMHTLDQWKSEGKPVQLIGNRSGSTGHVKEWERSLPFRPICNLPMLPHKDIMLSRWKGDLIQDTLPYLEILQHAAMPLLKALLPSSMLELQRNAGKWKRFWKRGS
jgi:serine/threonine protein kinase